MNRRRFLLSAVSAATATALTPWPARAQAKPLRFADMHSHIGILRNSAFTREMMTKNGVQLIARKVVADGPVIRNSGKGLQTYREPKPGELARYFDGWVEKLHAQHREERVIEVVSAETLDRAVAATEPAAVIAAEGGDFLDGDLKRLEAARAAGLVHLQLVHYRVSEVGDISTERPVHNGLTAFGKDVVAACGRLGILVDVAHGTSDLIDQVLELAAKPVIYSHGHASSGAPYWTNNVIQARAIHKPLAVKVAKKGGVVGLWPLGSQYRSLDAYADALLGMAEDLGPTHVGIGSDMFGLPSSVIPDYEAFPALEEILARRRVAAADIEGILGRNYLRVLRQSLAK
jgi:membrane dipeptidase